MEKLFNFLQSDKFDHFSIGFMFTVAIQPYNIGFVIACLLGLWKEYSSDRTTPGHVSDVKDLFWTIAGAVAGTIVKYTYILT